MKRGKTCLDCGFLTVDGQEFPGAERMLLLASQNGGILFPNHERTCCAQHRWVSYEIDNPSGSLDGVLVEIQRSREKCPGFMQYEHGYAPAKHFEFQEQRRRERFQWKIALLGIGGGIIGSFLRDVLRWLVGFWHLLKR